MKTSKQISRRKFLRNASMVAAVSGFGISRSYSLSTHNKKTNHQIGKHPWWVKEIDKPKLWIKEGEYQRYDGRDQIFSSFSRIVGEEKARKIYINNRNKSIEWIKKNKPGYSLRDRALANAAWTVNRFGRSNKGLLSWNKLYVMTPEEMGVAPFKASPREAAETVKAAAKLFGACLVGICRLDKRHFYSYDEEKQIVFEDVDNPYEDEEKRVIPNKINYAIAIAVQMSEETIKRAPAAIASSTSSLGYSLCTMVTSSLAEFIRGLGYTAIPSVNDSALSIPIAMEAGLGELGRHNRLITPEYGPCVRLCKVFTDLPMAIDKPIDFGAAEFCRTCKRCAEACPSEALSLEDDPNYTIKGIWNNPGHKAWFEDASRCYNYWNQITTGCSICFAVCPYTKKDKAWAHELVKASAAKTNLFNQFFVTMDDAFGYGRQKDFQHWWKLNLPSFGFDTTQGITR